MSRFQYGMMLVMLIVTTAAAAATTKNALPGCPDKCGNITVPFPFGIKPGCSRESFDLTCDDTHSPPRLVIYDDIQIISNISLQPAELTVRLNASRACYNETGYVGGHNTYLSAGSGRPFRISTRNRFTAIGCATFAYFDSGEGYYVSGCVSLCRNVSDFVDGSCTGVGCCQSSISPGMWFYETAFDDKFNKNTVADFSPCSYAFLVDENKFQFKVSDLKRTDDFTTPVALNWAIRNRTCDEAKRNVTSYACRSQNSDCFKAIDDDGYICNCSKGYHGNPYLDDGCQDIDECKLSNQYPCYGDCMNTNGSYTCKCPKGKTGDPSVKDGCRSKDHFTLALKAITGASVGIFFIVLISLFVCLGLQRRKLIRTKQKFFEQNGGFLVQQQIDSNQSMTFKIFSKEELEKATHNFDASCVLGRGGHGTVYKGVLADKTVVAIKKSKLMDASETKEFAKEMLILSQVNHKNVVKLLGCCLEVQVPMLVYEYVSNGTLYHFIHEKDHHAPLSLDMRLKIAVEAAEALSYLHSSASPPILHGDVKSANILLDDNFSAKVSDFGASKFAPSDEAQFATLVQGTCGYLDPEYMITSQLTEKSDVYSFGVVLLELLTRRKALYFSGPEEERCLASSFLRAMNGNRLFEIIDNQIVSESEREETIRDIAQLASQCLKITRDERPTMKEVAESLDMFRRYKKHSWIRISSEETQSLIDKH
ncbi:hypothetical protein Cni_G28106 [Canna indica]|uniref:Protein kinase domain-containing protein n=1 Tax=Canna indica TaxID=4628 RepID=A0AAQ3L211_9LILI|nr:hypothetical protein Cni_G28106 [Canna indica]